MKSMSRGVVTIETAYSDSDFKIEWAKVTKVNSKGAFIVSLESGERVITTIRTRHPKVSAISGKEQITCLARGCDDR